MLGFVLAGGDRHRVLNLLRSQELSVSEMVESLSIAPTRVSRALRQMHFFGLVERANTIPGKGALWKISDRGKPVADRLVGHAFPKPPRPRRAQE